MAKTATFKVNEADLGPCVHDVIGTGIAMHIGPKRSRGVQRNEGGRYLLTEGGLHAGAEALHVLMQQVNLRGEALHALGHRDGLGRERLPQPREGRLLPDRVRVEGAQTRSIAEERLGGVGLLLVQEGFYETRMCTEIFQEDEARLPVAPIAAGAVGHSVLQGTQEVGASPLAEKALDIPGVSLV